MSDLVSLNIRWDESTLENKVLKSRDKLAGINRQSAQEAGALYRDEARRLSPVKSGKLRNSWSYRTREYKGGELVDVVVQTNDENARFKLFPTSPHEIRARNGTALKFGGGFANNVMHPGTKGNNIFDKLARNVALQNKANQIVQGSLKRLADTL